MEDDFFVKVSIILLLITYGYYYRKYKRLFEKKIVVGTLISCCYLLGRLIRAKKVSEYSEFEKHISEIRSDLLLMADYVHQDIIYVSLSELKSLEIDLKIVCDMTYKKVI